MAVTCLRLATVFGLSPRMRFDVAINVMTKNAYVNRRITVDGGGRQWRPFVHVRDAARAFELALTSKREQVAGQVFNVGADVNNVQVLNLAFRVRDAVPGTEVVHAPTDPDLRDYNVSFEKVRRVLDFRVEVSIDDGIREVLGALRDGTVDPDERRWYTLKQYLFLRDAERAHRELAIDGKLLTAGS
jgi:nucleoside-diphosphate-sugar epimerase